MSDDEWDFGPPTPAPAAQPTGMWENFISSLGHEARLAGSAISNLPSDTAGFLGDTLYDAGKVVANTAKAGMRITPEQMIKGVTPPGSGPVGRRAQALKDKVSGKEEAPRGKVDQYLYQGERGLADMIPFALGGGLPAAARALTSGALGGVAGQAASDVFPNSPWAPTIASLFAMAMPEGIHAVRSAREAGRNIVAGSKMPGWQEVNDVIVGKLEGGGTLEHPKVSPKGAGGPQQVLLTTARNPGFGIKPWDGKTQSDLARVGRQYSAALYHRYDGDPAKTFAAYNGGYGMVDHLVKEYGSDWAQHIPHKETVDYVNKGMRNLGDVPPLNEETRHATLDTLPPEPTLADLPNQQQLAHNYLAELDDLGKKFDTKEITPAEYDAHVSNLDDRYKFVDHTSPPEVHLTPAEQQGMDATADKPVVESYLDKGGPVRAGRDELAIINDPANDVVPPEEPPPAARSPVQLAKDLWNDESGSVNPFQRDPQKAKDNPNPELTHEDVRVPSYNADGKTVSAVRVFDKNTGETFSFARTTPFENKASRIQRAYAGAKRLLNDQSGELRGDEPPEPPKGPDGEGNKYPESVQKLAEALRKAVPARAEQARMYTEERSARAKEMMKVRQHTSGVEGFYAEKVS